MELQKVNTAGAAVEEGSRRSIGDVEDKRLKLCKVAINNTAFIVLTCDPTRV